ncbi:MAG: transcriptional repressor [Mycoplasmataceae bacterium]|nr:transcriptional repressor [Mycoplasmataceae bacterium]
MNENRFKEILKESGIKVTTNRIAILSCLDDKEHFHSVADIEEHLDDMNTKSIYNNIKIFISKGIVDSYSFGSVTKYAINDHFHNRHNRMHVFDQNNNAIHVQISPKIYSDIKKEIKKAGLDPTSVSIMARVEKP